MKEFSISYYQFIKEKIFTKRFKKNLATAVALLGMLTILVSWENYRIQTVASIANEVQAFAKETEGLKIIAKSYTRKDSKAYLNKDLLKRGFQPIQITVQNNSPNSYELSTDSISLPSASPGKVATRVSLEALPRSIALRIASFFFWPFMIPGAIDSIITWKFHFMMRKDLSVKCIKEKENEEIVAPYSTFNRVIFVPLSELRDRLTVTLVEKDSKVPVSYISKIDDKKNKVVLDMVE